MVHHRRGLRRLLNDDTLLARIEADWNSAGLDERRQAMLGYVSKLTSEPASVTRSDVAALRAVGLDDRDILDLCEVTAYYAYVNRIAHGLGVEVEDWLVD